MSVKHFFKVLGLSTTIWIAANIINALIASMMLAATGGGSMLHELFGFVLVFSAMFSLPGLLLFVVIFLLLYNTDSLFEKLLFTAPVLAVASVVLLHVLEPDFPMVEMWWVLIPAAIGAAAAVGLHRSYIQRFSDSLKATSLPEDSILTGEDIE